MNNVRNEEYYDWDGGGDLDWEEVFRDEYEEKKRSEQMEADLEAVGGCLLLWCCCWEWLLLAMVVLLLAMVVLLAMLVLFLCFG